LFFLAFGARDAQAGRSGAVEPLRGAKGSDRGKVASEISDEIFRAGTYIRAARKSPHTPPSGHTTVTPAV